MSAATNKVESEETAEAMEGPSLSIGDLSAVVQLIDLCARRGAFEGREMHAVGLLRNKYATFLEANRPPEEPSEDSTEEDGEASAPDAESNDVGSDSESE